MIRIRIFNVAFILLLSSILFLCFSFYWLNMIIENSEQVDLQKSKNVSKSVVDSSDDLKSWWDHHPYLKDLKDQHIWPEGYLPSCKVFSNYSLSAISRTKSANCRKEIAELHCQKVVLDYNGAETLSPRQLTNLCPTTRVIHPELSGQYLGKKFDENLRFCQ